MIVNIDPTKLSYLTQVGVCAWCGTKLPPLPAGAFDDRLFCLGKAPCALLAMEASKSAN
jgi:hypothetical protein